MGGFYAEIPIFKIGIARTIHSLAQTNGGLQGQQQASKDKRTES
jgi:hypothetical protein